MDIKQIEILEKAELNCQDIEDLLYEIAEEELTVSLKGRVENHIHHCDRCKEEIDLYMKVIELAKELNRDSVELPSGVRTRLMARLKGELAL